MAFALALALVLVLSSVYLFHQWYTDDLAGPEVEKTEEEPPTA